MQPDGALLQATLLVLGLDAPLQRHSLMAAPDAGLLPVMLLLAIAVPLSSLGGLMVPGRAVALLIENPQMLARVKDATSWPSVTNGEALVTYIMARC